MKNKYEIILHVTAGCDEDGYTYCCNSPAITKEDALNNIKIRTILKWFESLPRPSVYIGEKGFTEHAEGLGYKEIKLVVPIFGIDMVMKIDSSVEDIVRKINRSIKTSSG